MNSMDKKVTQNRYELIKNRLLEVANKDEAIKAIVVIGSTTRKDSAADEFSDLDLMIATDDVASWLSDAYLGQLGNVRISFVEPTIGGGKEKRCIFEDCLDVDMMIFSPKQFEDAIREGVANWVCNRGYEVLYDRLHFSSMLKEFIKMEVPLPYLSEEEFTNMVNDFYFHIIWAAKKLLRGELWAAKMCMDAYLKQKILRVLELYTSSTYHVDVWHDGRFLDKWIDPQSKEELKKCFSSYEEKDMKKDLAATFEWFSRISESVAKIKGYTFPTDAKECAHTYLIEKL